MYTKRFLLAAVFALYPIALVAAPEWQELQELSGADTIPQDLFANAVAVSGTTAVVGASKANGDRGAAYIFRLAGPEWAQELKLVAPDSDTLLFGWSVAASGDRIVIGAPRAHENKGAAYVFWFNGNEWVQETKLTASDGEAYDEFGRSVAISGDTIVVGAILDDDKGRDAGAAYVFESSTTQAGTAWAQTAKLLSSETEATAWFGSAVAINENALLVAAQKGDGGRGIVYEFSHGQSGWSETGKLSAHGASTRFLGLSIALDSGRAVIGALDAHARGGVLDHGLGPRYPFGAGAAFVFRKDGQPGLGWVLEARLPPGKGVAGFGSTVAIAGDTVAVGAPGSPIHRPSSPGAVHIFVRRGTEWSLQSTLRDEGASGADRFGSAVALMPNSALVGATHRAPERGSLFVFKRPDACPPGVALDDGDPATLDVCDPDQGPVHSVVPDVDPTVVTTVAASTAFLYSGQNPPQQGVEPGTIRAQRAAALRGTVRARGAGGLSGVRITILNHPELGQTATRADGSFDMAVNGGGRLTVVYQKDGYLPIHRHAEVPWGDYVQVPDVVMTPADQAATSVASHSDHVQVHQGSPQQDDSGPRQATLLFKPETAVTLTLPDGSTQALPGITVRITEYTVGADGRQAMPAQLPANSGYTYAVELSADELAGPGEVRFAKPVHLFVDNFLDFPIGATVPAGYYDRASGAWIAAPDDPSSDSERGRVIRLRIAGGAVELHADDDGTPDDPDVLGLDANELQRLADTHAMADHQERSFWWVPIRHFSAWDINWGFAPPDDAIEPPSPEPLYSESPTDACEQPGSSIRCQSQVLGKSIPVVGTPYTLHYESDRVPGFGGDRTLEIPLTPQGKPLDELPSTLRTIVLVVEVAGTKHHVRVSQGASPDPAIHCDLATPAGCTFVWDGKDVFGRFVVGRQRVWVGLGYEYGCVYQQTSRFGYNGKGALITGQSNRCALTFWQSWNGELESFDTRGPGLGGWTLNAHHLYDPGNGVLYRGDGRRQQAAHLPNVVETIGNRMGHSASFGDDGPALDAGFRDISSMAFGPDGTLYVVDIDDLSASTRIRRIAPDGTIGSLAIPSYGAQYRYLAFRAADESLFISTSNATVLRWDTRNQTLSRVAGIEGEVCPSGTEDCGDGGPASEARLDRQPYLAVDPDGRLYLAEEGRHRIRRIDLDGTIHTSAGTGYTPQGWPPDDDGRPAVAVALHTPKHIVADGFGNIYFHEDRTSRIRRIGTDGVITTLHSGFWYDAWTSGLAVAADGSLYSLLQYWMHYNSAEPVEPVCHGGCIRRVLPWATRVNPGEQGSQREPSVLIAGGVTHYNPEWVDFAPDGMPATATPLASPVALALGPDGLLYWAERERKIRRLRQPTALVQHVPSRDGSEVYVFDEYGRHTETRDAVTNAVRFTMHYDPQGRLEGISDTDENATAIDRSPPGQILIRSPFGQTTTLELDANGFVKTIRNPANEAIEVAYRADSGLLERYTDARKHAYEYGYDDRTGRLQYAKDPVCGTTPGCQGSRLDRQVVIKTINGASSIDNDAYRVDFATPLERTSQYLSRRELDDSTTFENRFPSGLRSILEVRTDGTRLLTKADGSTVAITEAPDPRFGMLAPIQQSVVTTLPSGISASIDTQRTVELADPNDPLTLKKLTDEITVNGKRITREYIAEEQTWVTTTAEGRTSAVALDSQGRISKLHTPRLADTILEYDDRGRLEWIKRGDRRVRFAYHAQTGYLESTTLWDANEQPRKTSYLSDAIGRPLTITRPDNKAVGFAYDHNGNLDWIQPAERDQHHFQHIPLDLVSQYTPPPLANTGVGYTKYSHDLDRRLDAVTLPDAGIIDFVRNPHNGRLDALTLPSGTRTYHYNEDTGDLSGIDGAYQQNLKFTRDGPLPKSETWAGVVNGAVSWTWNSDFQVTSESVNDGLGVAFGHDADGLLTLAGELTLDYREYDEQNAPLPPSEQNVLLKGTKLSNVTDSITYNAYGETETYAARHGANLLLKLDIGGRRDLLGRVTGMTEMIAGETREYSYRYDSVGRLTDVSRDDQIVEHYEYDANGNRILATNSVGTVSGEQIEIDAQDRLRRYGTKTYDYTADGALKAVTDNVTGGTTEYTYDARGSLLGVTFPNGTVIEYVVDGAGRRVAKKVDGDLRGGLLYQGALRPVAELNGSGEVVSRFVYASRPNLPEYVERGGAYYRILTDEVGSPRLVVHADTGQIMQRMDYDAYGRVLRDEWTQGWQPIPFGFGGGLYDRDTGLVRFGARDYDPEVGRWTSKDLFSLIQGNLFAYANGDPVNLVDPLGLDAEEWFLRNSETMVNVSLGFSFVALNIATFGVAAEAGVLGAGAATGWASAELGFASLFSSVPVASAGAVASATSGAAKLACDRGLRSTLFEPTLPWYETDATLLTLVRRHGAYMADEVTRARAILGRELSQKEFAGVMREAYVDFLKWYPELNRFED